MTKRSSCLELAREGKGVSDTLALVCVAFSWRTYHGCAPSVAAAALPALAAHHRGVASALLRRASELQLTRTSLGVQGLGFRVQGFGFRV